MKKLSYQLKRKYAVSFLIIGLVLAALTGFQMITSLFGAPLLLSVNGNSMSPVFEQFDLLFLKLISPEEIKVGMIVAVDHRANGHFYLGFWVHRVIEIGEIDGEITVRTKGDFNDHEDDLVFVNDVKATVILSVPVIGFLLSPPSNVMIILVLLFLGVRYYKILPNTKLTK